MCHDFAQLNANIIPIQDTTPQLWDSIQKLAGKSRTTSYDVRNAYPHLKIAKECQKYVRFSLPDGSVYQWKRCCFGIRDLPAVWNSIMHKIYFDFIIYFDDIFHSNDTVEGFKRDFVKFLKRTHRMHLTIRVGKCRFYEIEVQVLGMLIIDGKIHPSEEQRSKYLNMPLPKSKTDLKRYLGVLSYKSKFIFDFSNLSYEFYELLRKDVKFFFGMII